MQIGRRRRQSNTVAQRAMAHLAEALEDRRLLAATALSYAAPVQTQISTTGAPVIGADVGDLNGDGIPDVVALGGVSIAGLSYTAQPFTGSSKGTFKGGNLSVAGGPTFALGDFTGDGKLDLATPSGVLPGNGDGTFKTATVGFNNPTGALSFIAADFNGDSKLDLAVTTFTQSGQNTTIGLDILIGNGDGTFKSPVVTNVKTSTTTLSQNDALFFVDDFNGDGKLDVLTPFGVLIGNGDGTFKSATQPLPVTPNLANPVFTAGDVNNDGKIDLLMVGTKSTAGQAELLTGKGDGTFTDGGPVTIASSGTVSALTIIDLNADSFPEIAAGIQPSGSASQIALLTNNGSGAFGTAKTFSVDGAPLEIFAGDMNGDKVPDIISIDSTPGLVTGAGTTFNASEVAVLLSNSTSTGGTGGTGTGGTGTGGTGTGTGGTGSTSSSNGLRPPDIAVKSSANPVLAGSSVTLTVAVSQRTGIVVPTGTVTFAINGKSVGTGTLNKFGRASVTLRRLGLGTQPITVNYPGDTNFGPTSTAISELVLSSLGRSPLVAASLPSVGFKAAFTAGDSGHVTIGLTNAGNAIASGTVSVALYLTQDGRIDDASIPLSIRGSSSVRLNLQRGHRQITTFQFTAPRVAVGLYRIIARVTAVSGITASELTNTTLLKTSKFRAADNQFGVVSRGNRISANINDGNGHTATFFITGAGVATYTSTVNGIDLVIGGTNAKSSLYAVGAAGFLIDHISINGAIGLVNAPGINLTDGVTAVGRLRSLIIGSAMGGAWALRNGIGSIQINGTLSNTKIFAGVNAGKDGVVGTADDTFAAAKIDSITIGGADTSSLVAAGVAASAGENILTRQVLLPKGRIGSIAVRGPISADSRFMAAVLPGTAVLDSRTVTVPGDVHFV